MEVITLQWQKIKMFGMSSMIILSKDLKKLIKRKSLVVMPTFFFIKKEGLTLKILKIMKI